jgi:hypothetical protein
MNTGVKMAGLNIAVSRTVRYADFTKDLRNMISAVYIKLQMALA